MVAVMFSTAAVGGGALNQMVGLMIALAAGGLVQWAAHSGKLNVSATTKRLTIAAAIAIVAIFVVLGVTYADTIPIDWQCGVCCDVLPWWFCSI